MNDGFRGNRTTLEARRDIRTLVRRVIGVRVNASDIWLMSDGST